MPVRQRDEVIDRLALAVQYSNQRMLHRSLLGDPRRTVLVQRPHH